MNDYLRIGKEFTGWLCLTAALYVFAAALSAAAEMFGLTNFPNDHRGEWALVVVPILLLLSGLFSILGIRRLKRFPMYTPGRIIVTAAVLVVVFLLWFSWLFSHRAI
jgi:amino acid transporter